MKKLIFCTMLLVCLAWVSKSQDLHFSQYQRMSAQLNPGLTGMLPGVYDRQFNLIYRDQWNSFLGNASFKTYGAAFEMRNCLRRNKQTAMNSRSKKFSVPTWGIGLTVLRDQTGTRSVKGISDQSYPLMRDYIDLSGSVILPMSDKTFLGGGFSGGVIMSSLDTRHLRYDEQFDGTAGFDQNIAGELDALGELNRTELDLGVGLAIVHLEKLWGIQGGAALDHAFRPAGTNLVQSEEAAVLSRRWTMHAKGSMRIYRDKQNYFGLQLDAFLMHQSPYQQFVGSGGFYYQNGDGLTATLSTGIRNVRFINGRSTDAILIKANFDFTRFALGLSYDINSSNLNEASRHYGAFEISLSYRFKKKNSPCAPALEDGCKLDGENIHAVFF